MAQSKAKAEKNQAMERAMNENSCQLCAVEKLTFEPPPIYCSLCGGRIKRNAHYYTVGSGETRHYLCIPCYNDSRGDSVEIEGTCYPKARFDKKKNDEETEEWVGSEFLDHSFINSIIASLNFFNSLDRPSCACMQWVQCDKCEAWQHQICALFNGKRNDGGQAEYTCPNCYIKEIDKGERTPLAQSAVLGAKDLPRTALSDHIEQRLFRRLKQEKSDRARHLGKSVDEVILVFIFFLVRLGFGCLISPLDCSRADSRGRIPRHQSGIFCGQEARGEATVPGDVSGGELPEGVSLQVQGRLKTRCSD